MLGLLSFSLHVSSEGGGEPHKLHVHGWVCGREGTAARTVLLKLHQSFSSGIQ